MLRLCPLGWLYPVLLLQSVLCVWYNGVDPSRKYSFKEHPVCTQEPSFSYTSTYKRVLWPPPLYNWGNWGTERINNSKNCSYSESQNLNFVTGFRISSYMQFWMLIMLTLAFVFQRQVYARQTLAVMHSIREAIPQNTLLGFISPQ